VKTSFVGASIALAFALILTAAPSFAEDFHCPKPGTVIGFNNGTSTPGAPSSMLTFSDQEGMVCVSRNATGNVVRRLLGIAAADSSFAKNHGERLFPFKVGNEVDFDWTADSSHLATSVPSANEILFYHDEVKVAREERLTTNMGTFDTFVIEWHSMIRNRNINGAWLYTMWFAPELDYVVKETDETRAGFANGNKSWDITTLIFPNVSPTVATPAPTPAPVATVTPAPQPVAPASPSVADRLSALKSLLDRKVITPAEYEAKRKEILKAL
jgi:hypothetical protein